MTAPGVLHLPAAALFDPHDRPTHARLAEHLGVRYQGVLSRRECVGYVRGVYAGRAAWVPNFDGVQFTLGRAWYVHLETDREREYFAHAAQADASVDRFVPGLAGRMLAMMSEFLGAPLARREGWCGPGVHVFPAGAWVSSHGGDVHFDHEGLPDDLLAAHADAISAILMLQPAAQGGGLRVWDKLYEDCDTEEAPGSAQSEVIAYGAGDLVFIDSYRLHQIEPSSGPLDRISMTAHAAWNGSGWEAWF